MQRFYFPTLTPTSSLTIREEGFVHQISRVLRSTPGDIIILFNGDGTDYTYAIEVITKRDITLSLTGSVQNTKDPKRTIRLYQALPNKHEKIEWIIEKWVEVGITSFTFFPSERSQKLVMSEKKRVRYREIAREALEQSGGNMFPEIVFREARGMPEVSDGKIIVLDTRSDGSIPLASFDRGSSDHAINIFVGPEGGWSDAEITLFRGCHAEIVHIDGRIMRTETAGITSAFFLLHTTP